MKLLDSRGLRPIGKLRMLQLGVLVLGPVACLRIGYDFSSDELKPPGSAIGVESSQLPQSRVSSRATSQLFRGASAAWLSTDAAPAPAANFLPGSSLSDSFFPDGGTAAAGNATNGTDAATVPDAWWDESYPYRRRIILDNRTQSETLINFPVGVRLDATIIDYTRSQSGGQDIRFVSADHSSVLAHEIEDWNSGGQSLLWVRVASLPAASNAESIWMYYGDANAANGENPASVWSNGYLAVWHLNSGSNDSTAREHNGSVGPGSSAVGPLANGRVFSAIGQHVNIGNPIGLANVFASGGSASAWIRANSYGGNNFGRIVDKALTTNAGGGWEMHIDLAGSPQQSFRFEHDFAGHWGAWETGTGTILLNNWYNVAVTFNASSSNNDPVLYINGSSSPHSERETPVGDSIDDSPVLLWLGDHSGTEVRNFDGTLDEVRISHVIRSNDWLRAEYLSATGALIQFAEESSLR